MDRPDKDPADSYQDCIRDAAYFLQCVTEAPPEFMLGLCSAALESALVYRAESLARSDVGTLYQIQSIDEQLLVMAPLILKNFDVDVKFYITQ